ncbi:hypothetical protein D3C72_1784580 [compost metagenome]
MRRQLLHGLRRRHASGEVVPVAHAAFILVVVEVQRAVTIQHGAHHLARGRRDSRMHHGGLVAQGRLLRELRIELHVGLRVIGDEVQLPAQQAAVGIDFFRREAQRVHDRLAIDVQPARQVINGGNIDFFFAGGEGACARQARQRGGRGGDGGGRQELAAVHAHVGKPLVRRRRAALAPGAKRTDEQRPTPKLRRRE